MDGIFTSDSIVAFTIYGVRIKFKIKVLTLPSILKGGHLIQDCGSEGGLSPHVAHIEYKCQYLFIIIIPLCCIIGKIIDVSPFYLN